MWENRKGDRVEPAPFVVMVGTGALVVWSFGPPYLLAWGWPIESAVGATGAVFACVVGWAYHRYVWTARPPSEHIEVPLETRLERLVIGGVIVAVVLMALTALLYLRQP